MATDNKKLQGYIEPYIYKAYEQFKKDRGIDSHSQVLNIILSEFLGVERDQPVKTSEYEVALIDKKIEAAIAPILRRLEQLESDYQQSTSNLEAQSTSNLEGNLEAQSTSNLKDNPEAQSTSNLETQSTSNLEGNLEEQGEQSTSNLETQSTSNLEEQGEQSTSNLKGNLEAQSTSNLKGNPEAQSTSNLEEQGEQSTSNLEGNPEAQSTSNLEEQGEQSTSNLETQSTSNLEGNLEEQGEQSTSNLEGNLETQSTSNLEGTEVEVNRQKQLDQLREDGYDVDNPLKMKEILMITGMSETSFYRCRDDGNLPEKGFNFIKYIIPNKKNPSYIYYKKKPV